MAEGPSAALGTIAAKVEGDLAWSRQKRMMQNRHQWEVADLRKAGLNPILSAGGAPSMASVSATKLPDFGSDFGMAGAATRKSQKSQRGMVKTQIGLLGEQTNTERAKQTHLAAQANSLDAQRSRYAPISDIGATVSKRITGPARSGDVLKGVRTVMSGNAKLASEMAAKTAWELDKIKKKAKSGAISIMEYLRREKLINERWEQN